VSGHDWINLRRRRQLSRRRLDVKQAAEVLGISSEGVRKRIKRGNLDSDKDADGKVYVWLDEDLTGTDEGRTDAAGNEPSAVEILREQIDLLRTELEDWKEIVATRDRELEARVEELRRKDHIIAQMNQNIAGLTERIPAQLESAREPSSDTRESVVTASDDELKGAVPAEPEKLSWWRRVFAS